jgi:polysaccharide export outer membrane protein
MKTNRPHVYLVFCASIVLSACTTVVNNPVPLETVNQMSQKAAATDYRIVRGDELDLRFVYTPELNTSATVRPDGKISAPLIGDIVVAGQTTTQLSETLKRAYAEQVKRPDVAINIRGFAEQRVFVGGEVGLPGAQPLIGRLSVLQAVMLAQGMEETAEPEQVVIVRRGENDERLVFSVNLEAVIEGEDTSQDVVLQPFDVVIVPRSDIANVNLWVDQYIRNNLPINFGVTYSFTNRRGTTTVPIPQ